ncbi:MAG: NADH dehydrogenase [Planctomycetes bacterium RIFCSPHIGHO2_02_FULL_50_42]|nr:MAG: NADH dehydrogenase [Planctomycetes bacterium GWA2_50_13]OHB89936.1 MAG: NADH dehydrogenase [Planctomycetes bacterium RIFCSPHIGHO2_02_FULL_50_42]OHB96141.1 MAG: NADH dehydrogenase [Planctomycetes bacterium RIFCSPLOWO2_02_FULL_50_16]OHC02821.1 MAG: NADH dehydrogenase [Planctomycetes bacterium RIFCSPLOWO2_12_FULL_50_35]HCN20431.1 NADH-quinone oxidoreductase subunit NuoF [Planctomycetia bacterium]
MDKLTSIDALKALRERLKKEQKADKRPTVVVCGGTGCDTFGGHALYNAFENLVEKRQLQEKVRLKKTGCQGLCERGPLVNILPSNIFYQKVKEQDATSILEETALSGGVIQKLLYTDPNTNQKVVYQQDIPFYKKQHRIVLMHNGIIDPLSINDYITVDGYASLEKALTKMTPDQVIEEITGSGLRGRGGAGFSTGTKWRFVRNAPGDKKYLICNGDEGDPGAFMDRSVLEGNPHSVIEGMLIAAYAMGAQEGFFYVRAEYPLAVANVGIAIQQTRDLGLLGKNILGSGLDFDLEIKKGAGAFVCGEETALIASIEGKRGMPRTRPPYPAISGLWGKPTCINNVETLANIPPIIEKGAKWYSGIGTAGSKGTKIFALAGNVRNTGLVEVPMGTTIREIIFDIGGGIARKRNCKAAQIGGPSGGCIPVEYLDTPIDYESLQKVGAIMGSGGLIVMDDKTSMVGMAKYFMNFIQDESCGKCVPCRIGTRRMLEILTRICDGQGREGDVELLSELATKIKETSLCGLGQTGPNPVLSTIRYFRHEYDDLIKGKKPQQTEKPSDVSAA